VLTQICPQDVTFSTQTSTTVSVSGTLTVAPAGSTVSVTFTKPPRVVGNQTVTPTETAIGTTDVQGAWTASVTTTDRSDVGGWSALSKYAGAPGFAATQDGPCEFAVHLPPPTRP
jgi:hypothetical protein